MNYLPARHLTRVLWLWLLVWEAAGEDGLAKSEKRLVLRSESGPRGESLQRSYVSTRVFSSSTSSSTLSGQTKPPDDRKSTTTSRLRNESSPSAVDLSRNTVPVLRSTEAKYGRSTTALPELKKLRRAGQAGGGVTRPRPADLTTLLAFNALGPGGQRQLYPSTTQLAESMPPTAWALASMRGPSTKRPGPHQVKQFVSWSTRLNKSTTPQPTTEQMESFTGKTETTVAPETLPDITGEGVDATVTVSPPLTTSSTNQSASGDIAHIQNTTTQNETKEMITEKPQDIATYKTEENIISVPPLSALKNSTVDDVIEKKDISANAQLVSSYDSDFSHEAVGHEPQMETVSTLHSTVPEKLNVTQDLVVPSQVLENPDKNITSITQSSESEISGSSSSTNVPITEEPPHTPLANSTSDVDDLTVKKMEVFSNAQNNDSFTIIFDDHKNVTLNATESQLLTTVPTPDEADRVPTEHTDNLDDLSSEVTIRRYDAPVNGSVQEADPALNIINEKKDDSLSTSTVVSAVNSTITMHVAPILTTPRIGNLTNLVEGDVTKPPAQLDIAKNLPLTAETTTTVSPTPLPASKKNVSSQQENEQTIINQTINDIKAVNDIKQVPVALEPFTEVTSSTKSNEIKHEASRNSSDADELKPNNNIVPEIPETTQSNYIQVHETIKPQNKTILPHFIVPQEKPALANSTIPITTNLTTESPDLSPSSGSTLEALLPSVAPENVTVGNDSLPTSSTTSFTTLPPVTTTPLPSSTDVPDIITTTILPSSISPNFTTSTTTKSNHIKDQENIPDMSLPIPEKNMTQFQYESPNMMKNESTPLIIQEPDDIEDEEGTFNNTDKITPGEHINNGDGDEDSDSFPEVLGNASIHTNEKNQTKNVPLVPPTSPTPLPTTPQPTSTKPNVLEEMPTQIDDLPNIDDDSVYDTGVIMSVYIQIVFEASSSEICRDKDQLRDAIVKIFKKYAQRTVDKRQVQLVNLGLRDCSGLRGEMDQSHTPVQLYLMDQQGQYDKALNDIFLSLARQNQLDFKYPITHIEKVIDQHELNMDTESQPSGTVVAAIIISSIAGVCLFALTILLVIMRKRQSGFNYGQRCTPVSLDDYSLDNISVYNSVRRKAMRASKRSYGNPAFDDPDVVSNPVNFAGLATMASHKLKTDEEFSCLPTVVVKPDELPLGAETKNRYANVIPLPETRVHLHASTPEDQFINANYVKGAKEAEKSYIACQAPLQNTIEDFWRMVWDEQCRLIIMLTGLYENGVEKCADYLPASEVLDCHRVFGDLQVTLKKRESREKYVIASLQLKNLETNLWREVTHMWYAGWPPTGVPPEPSSMIAFLIEARSYAKGAPTVVHCSPGTGRTGTVIAIDIAIRDFEAGRTVDIPKTVIQVRRGRAGAVQTKDQYSFIYKVLHFYATKLMGGGLDSI